jgi:glutathione S-transferase
MSALVVYSIPGSPFGRAVLITLEEKGVPYRLVPVPPNTLRTPEHLGRHPFGRVPVLEHGHFRVRETQAILRYLDRVLPQPALTPADPHAAARMDELMNVNDWYVFQGVGNVIAFQRIVAPRVLGRTADEAAIAAALPRARHVFDALAGLLGSQPYFAGEAFTLADALLAPQLDFLGQTPEWPALTANHANLGRWLERMRERPSFAATTWEKVAAMGCGPVAAPAQPAASAAATL